MTAPAAIHFDFGGTLDADGDMTGARQFGMRHVWLAPRATSGCCAGDRVVPRLANLPEVLP